MSIVHKYKFYGGSNDGGLAAAINLQDITTVMTSTFQFGGGPDIDRLGVPAGLVLSTSNCESSLHSHSDCKNQDPDVMPEEMFDRMLSLVGNTKIRPVFTNRASAKNKKSERKTRKN